MNILPSTVDKSLERLKKRFTPVLHVPERLQKKKIKLQTYAYSREKTEPILIGSRGMIDKGLQNIRQIEHSMVLVEKNIQKNPN